MRLFQLSLSSAAPMLALLVPCRISAQVAADSGILCDSVLRAARVDSVAVTARAFLVRRDGEPLPPRARMLLLEAILGHFAAPKPLQVPVFTAGPVRLRMLRPGQLGGDSITSREPLIYGVYDFSVLRNGGVSKVVTSVPSLSPDFDASVVAAIAASNADSITAVVRRALDTDTLRLELRITTGPDDSRFRVPGAQVFVATFPRVRLVDARARNGNPQAQYPLEERDEGRDGEVVLRVVVNASGVAVIATLEVLHATSPEFALSAARALARYHFTPAHVGPCPVPQVVEVPFWFSLRP